MTEIDTFQTAMMLGHSEAWDNAWEKAADFYQQALELLPDHPKANAFLGLAFFELRQFKKSLIYYEKAASLFLQTRNTGAAIECLKRIIRVNPDHTETHIQLALFHERRGKKQEAVDEYLAAAVAQQSQQADAAQHAIQWVETCLRLIPDHRGAENALALLRSGQPLARLPWLLPPSQPATKPAPARADIPALSPLHEADQAALTGLAAFFFQAAFSQQKTGSDCGLDPNDTPDGQTNLTPEHPDSTTALRDISQALEFQAQSLPDLALEGLNSALQMGLKHPCMHYMAGSILSSREPISAIRHLKQAYLDPVYSLAAVLLMGRILAGQGKHAEAAAAFLQALAIADSTAAAPESSEVLRQQYEPIIKAYSHLDDPVRLEKVCRFIDAELNRPDWLKHLTRLRECCMNPEYGCNPIAEILIAGGSAMVERIVQVKKLMEMKCHYPAMDEAFSLLEMEPTLLPAHLLIAEQLVQQNAVEEAARKFSLAANLYTLRQQPTQGMHVLARAVRIAPMDVSIRSQLIHLLIDHGQLGAAAEQMLQLAETQYQLAELHQARQTLSDAVRLIENDPAHRPLLRGLLTRKADLDLQHLDFRAAVGAHEQLRSLEPEDIQNRVRLVDLYYRMGQNSAAQKEMDDFIRLAENIHKQDLVVQFLEQVVAELPEQLEIRKRLADYYYKKGDRPNTIDQLDAIAGILLKKGSHDGVLIVLKTIVALNPPNVSEYQQALAQLSEGQ